MQYLADTFGEEEFHGAGIFRENGWNVPEEGMRGIVMVPKTYICIRCGRKFVAYLGDDAIQNWQLAKKPVSEACKWEQVQMAGEKMLDTAKKMVKK